MSTPDKSPAFSIDDRVMVKPVHRVRFPNATGVVKTQTLRYGVETYEVLFEKPQNGELSFFYYANELRKL